MDYLLIKGTFHVIGKRPDGDTLSFRASNKKNWEKLRRLSIKQTKSRTSVDLNKRDQVGIRFESIDALETRFKVRGGITHQPLKWVRGIF